MFCEPEVRTKLAMLPSGSTRPDQPMANIWYWPASVWVSDAANSTGVSLQIEPALLGLGLDGLTEAGALGRVADDHADLERHGHAGLGEQRLGAGRVELRAGLRGVRGERLAALIGPQAGVNWSRNTTLLMAARSRLISNARRTRGSVAMALASGAASVPPGLPTPLTLPRLIVMPW
jgi:hypothetical protein